MEMETADSFEMSLITEYKA